MATPRMKKDVTSLYPDATEADPRWLCSVTLHQTLGGTPIGKSYMDKFIGISISDVAGTLDFNVDSANEKALLEYINMLTTLRSTLLRALGDAGYEYITLQLDKLPTTTETKDAN